MGKRTIGEILRPTKGADSYPKITIRANNWLREQAEAGRELEITRMSFEQARRIFEDAVDKPRPIYLEALAAVQGVDVNDLYRACGYHSQITEVAPAADRATSALREIPDMETKVQVFLNGASELPDFAKDQIREMVKDAWGKRQKEIANGKP